MLPASFLVNPAKILIKVDFPAPFSPRIAWISPVCAEKLQLLYAFTSFSLKYFTMFIISMPGVFGIIGDDAVISMKVYARRLFLCCF